jgi:hypothetical protein
MKINDTCETCKGKGFLVEEFTEARLYIRRCLECGGIGKLDWVSKITKSSIREARKNVSMSALVEKFRDENHVIYYYDNLYPDMALVYLYENQH